MKNKAKVCINCRHFSGSETNFCLKKMMKTINPISGKEYIEAFPFCKVKNFNLKCKDFVSC